MKAFINKKTMKKSIIVLMITIMLSGLVPNLAFATTDTNGGGNLLKPVEQLVVFIGDALMQWLQKTFISTDNIYDDDAGSYNFQYSPAIIFSGTVPALDINFINPNTKSDYEGIEDWLDTKKNDYIKIVQGDGCIVEESIYNDKLDEAKKYRCFLLSDNGDTVYSIYYNVENNSVYVYVFYHDYNVDFNEVDDGFYYCYTTTETLTDEFLEEAKTIKYTSTAYLLQDTIATWYNALRRIALVGLLSVLVYVGIRIVLTSSSQDKAKYKAMLKDWLVAICLLFTLHYIMSATLLIVDEISDVFSIGGTDPLLNNLRNEIRNGSWTTVLAKTIMYAVLVIFTCVYTIQYLFRVIHMAFYTLIAPLITLTYPLDKIKDGQAQAFNMWLREYIFTALIQVIHLVIYYALVSSALELVNDYEIIAIITFMFIKKAEGIIKKMFGFDKSETVGTIGAAATGALAMNLINNLAHKPPKGGKKDGGSGEKSGGDTSSNVRTVMANPLAGISTGTTSATTNNAGAGINASKQQSKIAQMWNKPKIKGARNVVGKYFKEHGKDLIGSTIGVGTGIAGGIIGTAAGIAQGDVSAAFMGAKAGMSAGKNIGKGTVNYVAGIPEGVRNVYRDAKYTYMEGVYGEEAAQAMRFDEEFREGSVYEALQNNSNFSDEKVQSMLDNGITDKKEMIKILDSGIDIDDAIKYNTLAKNCPDTIYYNDYSLKTFWKSTMKVDEEADKIRDILSKFK